MFATLAASLHDALQTSIDSTSLPGSSSRPFRSAHHHGLDQSGPRGPGISDLIAEPERPTFISCKVVRSRLDRLRFVTQDPNRTFGPF
jgi:hypothetical protein